MLEESKLPKSFWADAMATTAYVMARSPADGLKGGTPYEAPFNRHVNPTLFQRFGSEMNCEWQRPNSGSPPLYAQLQSELDSHCSL